MHKGYRSPKSNILGQLSPALHSFRLFGQQIEGEEVSEVFNSYDVTVEFDRDQQLNIYFYPPGPKKKLIDWV